PNDLRSGRNVFAWFEKQQGLGTQMSFHPSTVTNQNPGKSRLGAIARQGQEHARTPPCNCTITDRLVMPWPAAWLKGEIVASVFLRLIVQRVTAGSSERSFAGQ